MSVPLRPLNGDTLTSAAIDLRQAHDEVLQKHNEWEGALKAYAQRQHEECSAAVSPMLWVKGIYYLTIARWTDPPRHKLALKVLKWLREDD